MTAPETLQPPSVVAAKAPQASPVVCAVDAVVHEVLFHWQRQQEQQQ